jgi:hypothetical protein
MVSAAAFTLLLAGTVGVALTAERVSGYFVVTTDQGDTLCATSINFGDRYATVEINGTPVRVLMGELGSVARTSSC